MILIFPCSQMVTDFRMCIRRARHACASTFLAHGNGHQVMPLMTLCCLGPRYGYTTTKTGCRAEKRNGGVVALIPAKRDCDLAGRASDGEACWLHLGSSLL